MAVPKRQEASEAPKGTEGLVDRVQGLWGQLVKSNPQVCQCLSLTGKYGVAADVDGDSSSPRCRVDLCLH